ncbi:SDR family oxidoreductase [Thermobifida cellulosilytica]|uniref:NmrA family transcriptional regulator n=1 Tax=Thermobifida cellulosilytica TB100 TaxID=665004 RepID=A0A147KEP2_THECS|nr:NAD(P)H-binding protein [Thermobifida cellulosilytica]KUP95771.1 NmrA family transcriptional regulator [Thermobifida cellulosilytica TB100]
MTPPVLVTGGTGTLGRHVVPLLRRAGRRVRVLSRRPHDSGDGVDHVVGDLRRDTGVDAAVEGADTVLHLAGAPRGDDEAARVLVRAAARAGVRHLVFISIIGVDRVPLGFYRAKYRAEQAVAGSGVPWTVLRAAQFHDLVLAGVRSLAAMPVVPVPRGLRMQPVDADEVAARLVALALGGPAGRVPDLAGPKVYPVADLVRGYLRVRGMRRLLLPVPVPGRIGRAYREGANLSREGVVTGGRTWEEFLAERVGTP